MQAATGLLPRMNCDVAYSSTQ